jgi:hypothetical protein
MNGAEAILELMTNEHASAMGREVSELFMSCLFKQEEMIDGKPTLEPVIAEGITQDVGFHPERIAAAKPKVVEFIKQLGDEFIRSKGGGWSFLNLCYDRDGKQWANLHRTMEQLVQLAIGCGLGGYCLSRENWQFLLGGVPYVWFELPEEVNDVSN